MDILEEIGYTGVPTRETKLTTQNIVRCLLYSSIMLWLNVQ